jgi:hypothetical protein
MRFDADAPPPFGTMFPLKTTTADPEFVAVNLSIIARALTGAYCDVCEFSANFAGKKDLIDIATSHSYAIVSLNAGFCTVPAVVPGRLLVISVTVASPHT